MIALPFPHIWIPDRAIRPASWREMLGFGTRFEANAVGKEPRKSNGKTIRRDDGKVPRFTGDCDECDKCATCMTVPPDSYTATFSSVSLETTGCHTYTPSCHHTWTVNAVPTLTTCTLNLSTFTPCISDIFDPGFSLGVATYSSDDLGGDYDRHGNGTTFGSCPFVCGTCSDPVINSYTDIRAFLSISRVSTGSGLRCRYAFRLGDSVLMNNVRIFIGDADADGCITQVLNNVLTAFAGSTNVGCPSTTGTFGKDGSVTLTPNF